ncbi:MAG TPA: glycerophosphodiester phosphodiesterase family protein [Vicinamibacteria bacterium]|nr:glycerophosphodiester phosphodiesterase family protein [Vicinamibacteria bacterium]
MAPPLVIAHRGDSAHRPENTLAAFAGALEVGAAVVELDVQLTADRQLVVLHDVTLDRTTDSRGDVRRMTLAEVRAASAGYPALFGGAWAGERVPTLAEVLGLVRGRARVLIEVKGESVTDEVLGGVEAHTVDVVRRLEMVDQVAVISFEHRALLHLRTLAPEITRGHLFGRTTPDEVARAAADAGCSLVMPHKSQLSDALSARVRAEGLSLATWVVDEPEELRRLVRFGLYGVGSNRPGVLLDAVADGLLD